MKEINVEVYFIAEDDEIVNKDKNLIQKKYLDIILQYAKYIDATVLTKEEICYKTNGK